MILGGSRVEMLGIMVNACDIRGTFSQIWPKPRKILGTTLNALEKW